MRSVASSFQRILLLTGEHLLQMRQCFERGGRMMSHKSQCSFRSSVLYSRQFIGKVHYELTSF